MRVTENDQKIYKYICQNGFATVKHIANVFYNDIVYKNELAKKRLKCLIEHGYIKKNRSVNCTQDVFYSEDKYKRQTYHNIVVMDFYTKLLEMKSVKVIKFEKEKVWGHNEGLYIKGNVVSDAYIVIEYKGIMRIFLLEVQSSKNDWRNTIKKYEQVVPDIMRECDATPTIIIADDITHIINFDHSLPVCQIDCKLTDFPLIFDVE
jgi:hypothetical protein